MRIEILLSQLVVWATIGVVAQDPSGDIKRRNHNVFRARKSAPAKSDAQPTPQPTPDSTLAVDQYLAGARKKGRGESEKKRMNMRGKREKGSGKRSEGRNSEKNSMKRKSKNKQNKDGRMDNDSDDDDEDDLVFDNTSSPVAPTNYSPAPTTSRNPTRAPTTRAPVTSRPTRSPVVGPAPTATAPTAAIVTPTQAGQCNPTVGPCIDNFFDLTDQLINLDAGNTISICQGTITTSKALNVVSDNTVLCCDNGATSACIIQSSGTDRNLEVRANTFSTLGVTYVGGTSDESGGNVFISGSGTHELVFSTFRNGTATESGGNVFVETDGNVLVLGSSFESGFAGVVGGGLSVDGASTLGVIQSSFENNEAADGGGLYAARGEDPIVGMQAVIEDSNFTSNTAVIGGGLMVSNLGVLPSLAILNTDFTLNFVGPGMTSAGPSPGGVGGAATIFEPLTNLRLMLGSNSGMGNVASGTNNFCAGLLTVLNETLVPRCIQPRESYPN